MFLSETEESNQHGNVQVWGLLEVMKIAHPN